MPDTKFYTPPNAVNSANIIHVKSKFGEEFRRFGLKRTEGPHRFEDFNALVRQLHGLVNMSFVIHYVDPSDHELLPINNDYNFEQALKTSERILRVTIERKDDRERCIYKSMRSISCRVSMRSQTSEISISMPKNFRQVSAIIDVDIVPETYRRVRLLKHGSDKPLGFYIRDGIVRVTPSRLEKQPGIFISRISLGGLAESSGLLSVNDEIIEVNGIEVAGKTLDQVTDMMMANSSNLIITFKPSNQDTLTFMQHRCVLRTSQLSSNTHHINHTNTSDELEQDDQDEIVDLTGVTLDDNTGSGGGGSANGDGVLHL